MTRRLKKFHYHETMFLYGVLGLLFFLRTLEGAALEVPGSSSSNSSKSTKDHTSDLSSTNITDTTAQEKPKFVVVVSADDEKMEISVIPDDARTRRDYSNHSYPRDENGLVIPKIYLQRSDSTNDDLNSFTIKQSQRNYARSPSKEVNDVDDSKDYEERNGRPYGQQNYSKPTTKPGEETHRNPSYSWLPPSLRTIRKQQDSQGNQSRSGKIDLNELDCLLNKKYREDLSVLKILKSLEAQPFQKHHKKHKKHKKHRLGLISQIEIIDVK